MLDFKVLLIGVIPEYNSSYRHSLELQRVLPGLGPKPRPKEWPIYAFVFFESLFAPPVSYKLLVFCTKNREITGEKLACKRGPPLCHNLEKCTICTWYHHFSIALNWQPERKKEHVSFWHFGKDGTYFPRRDFNMNATLFSCPFLCHQN